MVRNVKATDVEIILLTISLLFGMTGYPLASSVVILACLILMIIHGIVNPKRAKKWADWIWKD